ncbi:MAG: GTP-binding protein [candidate division KSB1 bacterium]|nr:GTP-binding protein [candidate division KSB1 bacterium]MDZ7333814.1 GTP-binding protein [candidate division KSB1 bacterium]MDZ7356057.1 GTP-binding protein [candidate division KSB1 bacterium]MDZ7376555.1 GTP-binding protein [candidate division KSB1 bacterium]MDZ7400574.1 GTP-binding protein [candidate division KSB1 bacterium]
MIPTILLTGFLGAGKTTLLNRLIGHYRSKRTVLLINEFGKVGIDGELLTPGTYQKVELNKGSLFCICVRTDFIFEVERIATDLRPELLIIEATGLADTSEMEEMLALPNLKNHVELKANICLVDCQNFLKIKDTLRAPISQIQTADLVLLNKIDLVSDAQVEQVAAAVVSISPGVPILRTKYAEFDLTILDAIQHPKAVTTGELGEGRPDPVASVTLESEGQFTHESWDRFRDHLPTNLMRLKGFIFIGQQCYYVDATMDQFIMKPILDGSIRQNRLVLIGRRLNEEEIERQFFSNLFVRAAI